MQQVPFPLFLVFVFLYLFLLLFLSLSIFVFISFWLFENLSKPEAIRQVPSSPSFCNAGSSRLNSYLFTWTRYFSTYFSVAQMISISFEESSSFVKSLFKNIFRKCIMDVCFIPRRAQRQQEVHRKRKPPGFEVPVSRICIFLIVGSLEQAQKLSNDFKNAPVTCEAASKTDVENILLISMVICWKERKMKIPIYEVSDTVTLLYLQIYNSIYLVQK